MKPPRSLFNSCSAPFSGLVVHQMPIVKPFSRLTTTKPRNELIKEIFDRHECKVMASYVDEAATSRSRTTSSPAQVCHRGPDAQLKGAAVANDLKAIIVLTTGGFWGKQSVEVTVSRPATPRRVRWPYQTVIEKTPPAGWRTTSAPHRAQQVERWAASETPPQKRQGADLGHSHAEPGATPSTTTNRLRRSGVNVGR